jgi:ABC-2 type transport system permease protein/oleandomycin transport system permease protein
MSTVGVPSRPLPAPPRMTPLVALGDIGAMTKRNLLHIARTPQLLFFATVQPVMFVLLFRYVFGGAIRVGTMRYVDYLMAGIFVQTTLFGGASTAVGLTQDLSSGIVDRFRSLPMARSAVLAGRTFADLVRNVFVVILMVVVGTLVGFRFHGGFVPSLSGLVLVIVFGYAFSWMFAAMGLAVKDPETAQVAGFVPIFPLVFASSAFVQVKTMPSWLQAFARVQPVSVTMNAVRALTQGGPVAHWLWQSVAWTVAILVVFVPLTVRQYRKV